MGSITNVAVTINLFDLQFTDHWLRKIETLRMSQRYVEVLGFNRNTMGTTLVKITDNLREYTKGLVDA